MEFLNLGIYFIVELVFIVLLVLADGLKLLPEDLLSFFTEFFGMDECITSLCFCPLSHQEPGHHQNLFFYKLEFSWGLKEHPE